MSPNPKKRPTTDRPDPDRAGPTAAHAAVVGDDLERLRRVWRKLAAVAEALEEDEDTLERHRDEIRQIRHCSWVCYDVVVTKAAV